jgi:hypothetical protein
MDDPTYGFSRPSGDITTLLDLAPRDVQDNEFTPLSAEKTWWLPDKKHTLNPFSLSVQQFPFRGPTGFGQRFTCDIGALSAGDVLLSTILHIDLGHWLTDTTILRLEGGLYKYNPSENPWYYANCLGTVILERAELEVGDQTIEIVDGDFLNTASLLFQDTNNQYGLGVDGLGRYPHTSITQTPSSRPFPTTSHSIFVPLPFFFTRTKLKEVFPLLACTEGSVRIHITLRPFNECVRLLNGRRTALDENPLNKILQITDYSGPSPVSTSYTTAANPPQFKKIQLVTYGAVTEGKIRQRILRSPFEILMRNVQTFSFSEPLKYATNKTSADTIQVQLPLEPNHPMEEIIWFVRRKAAANNNEWTNYSSVMSAEYDATYNTPGPLLSSAAIQLNGIELINQEEQWFRQHISLLHKGGVGAYNSFVYGYSFAKYPGEHQPSGTANASRLQSIRLTLDVRPPGGNFEQDWEVKVFVMTLGWLRFQNGIANKMYTD